MVARRWRLLVANSADADIDGIIEWTISTFGERQAEAYHQRLVAAFEALAIDPFASSSRDRKTDLGKDHRSLHLGRRARHLIVYRVDADRILVLRVLHDSMDLSQHVQKD